MSTFCTRFKSYYSTTYEHYYTAWEPEHVPVKSLEKRKISVEDSATRYGVPQELEGTLKELLETVYDNETVYDKMGEGNFEENRAFYEKRGFRVLKAGGTLVLEHDSLPGYLIKTTGVAREFHRGTIPDRTEKVPIKHTNLLRAEGRAYYEERSTDPMFTFPQEYLYEYEYPHADSESPLHRRFFSISEKVTVYSPKESIEQVRNLNSERQIALAQKVCDFIKKTGLVDMHDGNLLLRKDLEEWTFSLIDLEPLWLFIEQNDENTDSLEINEMLVLLGLIKFRDYYCRKNGLTEMAHYVDDRIQEYVEQHPKLKGKEINDGNLSAGIFVDKVQEFDALSVLKILLTIPFFFIVLPILAIRAGCSAPQEQLA
jgi:hypothetical protein